MPSEALTIPRRVLPANRIPHRTPLVSRPWNCIDHHPKHGTKSLSTLLVMMTVDLPSATQKFAPRALSCSSEKSRCLGRSACQPRNSAPAYHQHLGCIVRPQGCKPSILDEVRTVHLAMTGKIGFGFKCESIESALRDLRIKCCNENIARRLT